LVFDRTQDQTRVLAELGGLVGEQGRTLRTTMIEGASRQGSSGWARGVSALVRARLAALGMILGLG
jgi:hypothetical protein